jgi:dolichol-phosphate mannosyltransferase
MADGSDDPADLIKYYNKLNEGYDCVFGSRFIRGSESSIIRYINLS